MNWIILGDAGLTHWLLELFAKNAFFGHFGDFQAGYGPSSSNLLKKAFATWQHAFLSTSIAFYGISAQACAEIKILKKWPTSSGFSIFFFFFTFPFSPFLFFLLQWLTFYWACFQFKTFWESIIETGNFCHGVATCRGRKFCSEFFTQLFEHFCAYLRLHWTDHSDLGIIGKIFSFCRSWA